MTAIQRRVRARLRTIAGALTLFAAGTLLPGSATADSTPAEHDFAGPKPTIVLVHGAFTDASSWHGVIANLRHAGYPVVAPPNPLRDLATDSAYVADIVRSIHGPVIMVGHSYGGAVITNAARETPNVQGLVYVAGFAPDKGESIGSISAQYPDTPLKTSIVPLPHPDGTVDVYLDPAKFRHVFAQDVPRGQTDLMAITQRPITATANNSPSGEPAWRRLPSWFLIPTDDHALHPAAQTDMANRAHAKQTIKISGGHALPVSHPAETAQLIRKAASRTHHR